MITWKENKEKKRQTDREIQNIQKVIEKLIRIGICIYEGRESESGRGRTRPARRHEADAERHPAFRMSARAVGTVACKQNK